MSIEQTQVLAEFQRLLMKHDVQQIILTPTNEVFFRIAGVTFGADDLPLVFAELQKLEGA